MTEQGPDVDHGGSGHDQPSHPTPAPWAPPVEWTPPPAPQPGAAPTPAGPPVPPPPPAAPGWAPDDRPPPLPQHPPPLPHHAPQHPQEPHQPPQLPPPTPGGWQSGPPLAVPTDEMGYPLFGPGSLPSIVRRAVARLIDLTLVFLVYFAAAVPLIHVRDGVVDMSGVPTWYPLLTLAIDTVYESIAVTLFATTIGKRLLGLRVEGPDGTGPGWQRSTVRILFPNMVGAVPGIGALLEPLVFLTAMWNPLRQGLHDRLAGTLVTSTR